jgi:acyl-CoA thioesterase-1
VLPPWHHPVPRYQDNLRKIIDALRRAGVRSIIWASSTPVHDGWHNVDVRTGKTRGVLRSNADVIRYNAAAAAVMTEQGVPIDDLYGVVRRHGLERCLIADGVHLSAYGAKVLGEHVAATIRRLAGGRW